MLRKLTVAGALLSVTRVASAVTFVDPGFVDVTVATKVGAPTAMAWAPDGSSRLFITSKEGGVWIIENGARVAAPFVQVTPIETGSECGLLGIAFDPDFVQNHYVYLFVSVSASEQQIVRYTANGNIGTDKTVILSGLPTLGKNHDGGALAFGPDGKLYFAIGDNGARLGVGSDLTLLNAKVGRTNRDGTAPTDNPFFDGDGPHNDYIWASGFRNPFKMTFQPGTGELWLNVVGTDWEQVFTPRAGDNGGWNAYESNQPPGYLAPAISYATDAVATRAIPPSGTVRLGGVSTVHTTEPHRFRPGANVTVAGVTNASFNGTFVVSAALSPTQFSYVQAGPDAVSGSGTASSQNIGGCVVGGAFWDSSGVPAAYRGNFFFGDYNSGRIVRTTFDADNGVTSVAEWASGAGRIVDMSVGDDGDLYFTATSGDVHRLRYEPAAQALVVSRRNVRLAEGGKAAFDVRLALPTTTPRTVTLTKTGDADIAIVDGAPLMFDADNWSVPQRVVLAAAVDVDSLEDAGRIRIASSRLAVEDVSVNVTEAEVSSFVVSTTALELAEGETAQVTIALTEPPSTTLPVYVSSSGDPDVRVIAGAELSFTATDWAIPQPVTITAIADADGADDVATLRISGRGRTSRQVPVLVVDPDESSPGGGGAPGGDAGGGSGTTEPGAGGELAEVGGQAMGRGGQSTGEGGQPTSLAGQPSQSDQGGEDGANASGAGNDGCGCRVAATPRSEWGLLALALGWGIGRRRRGARL